MYQIRLPIIAEKTALVSEKVAEVAENVAYYAKLGAEKAKAGAKKFKNFNEAIEQKARETKIEYQQAIRKEEFRQINQEIIDGSENYNPQLVERTDTELMD
ncbi:20011_t:CDS:2 [Entrophospora sp. SA101]|nr:11523_t:CDS:2 [Entrophospora sp. SA101]CAJ0747088.1 20011_t:CDS:2 [Entrophospora sp. SA101]CAJ0836401.1 2090_t:CDS:2 [Entrophospora sp. SA101]CAJ0858608.1 11754_t:CDS:2 [Entrophospora sp. SA101]